jgi:hypothetical protein
MFPVVNLQENVVTQHMQFWYKTLNSEQFLLGNDQIRRPLFGVRKVTFKTEPSSGLPMVSNECFTDLSRGRLVLGRSLDLFPFVYNRIRSPLVHSININQEIE